MIKKMLLFAIAIILCASLAPARNPGFGLGIIVGEPTGPCFKAWTGTTTAIDGAAAWSLDHNNTLHLHVDYLVHNFSFIKLDKGSMPFYYGIGGRMEVIEHSDDDIFGARIPLGLEYLPHKTSLGIFMEFVPVLNLIPDTDFDMDAAIGIRLYF